MRFEAAWPVERVARAMLMNSRSRCKAASAKTQKPKRLTHMNLRSRKAVQKVDKDERRPSAESEAEPESEDEVGIPRKWGAKASGDAAADVEMEDEEVC
jgi:hypothetical protein